MLGTWRRSRSVWSMWLKCLGMSEIFLPVEPHHCSFSVCQDRISLHKQVGTEPRWPSCPDLRDAGVTGVWIPCRLRSSIFFLQQEQCLMKGGLSSLLAVFGSPLNEIRCVGRSAAWLQCELSPQSHFLSVCVLRERSIMHQKAKCNFFDV